MTARIDPDQPLPAYAQLKTLLLDDILRGVYPPGAKLPTEHELCAIYGISRTPVNRALVELANEGIVVRHRRRGTSVNPHWRPTGATVNEVRVVVPDGSWEDLLRQAVPAEVNMNIARVELTDLHRFLINAVAEGQAPDLAIIDSVWTREFAASGFLAPLNELDPTWISSEHDRDFIEPFRTANRYQGNTVAIQAETDVAGLWFHRADLETIGAAPPASWTELDTLLRTLAQHGHPAPLVLPGGVRGAETTTYCLLALLAANGAQVLDDSHVTLDTPETVEALEFVTELVKSGLIPVDVVTYEWDRPIEQLASGRARVAFGGSYDSPALAKATGLSCEHVLDHFEFTPIPIGPSGRGTALAGGMAYAIFRQAAHPVAAMQALKEVVSTASLSRMSRTTRQLAPRASAIQAVSGDSPFLRDTGAMLADATVRPSVPQYVRVSAQLASMLEAVITGRLNPADATARAAELISAITALPVRSPS